MLYNAKFLLEDARQHLKHRQTLHMVLLSVGTTVAGVMRQLSVDLSVLFRETSKWRGLSEHNSGLFDVKKLDFSEKFHFSSKFLLDTGASVSMFHHRPCSPSSPGVGVQLRTASGSTMNTYGTLHIAL